jgi:hypothetical protein
MFSNVIVGSNIHKFRDLIDTVVNIGLIIILVSAPIVVALAIGAAPMSTGDTLIAMPTSEWQSNFDQHVIRPPSYEGRAYVAWSAQLASRLARAGAS